MTSAPLIPDHRNGTRSLRLVVVDDHVFARETVAQSLEVELDIEVVGQAGTVADARAAIQRLNPDVAIIDLNLPDGSGRDLVEHFTQTAPDLRCVIYTSHVAPDEAASLIEVGASAVILKSLRSNDLIDAIRDCGDGPSRSTVPRPYDPWGGD